MGSDGGRPAQIAETARLLIAGNNDDFERIIGQLRKAS